MKKLDFPIPLIIRFTRWNYLYDRDKVKLPPSGIYEPLLSWGKLRGEPATRWFDWSFAPILKSRDRFARQNRFGLPPWFPVASSSSSIDHHLSGRLLYATSRQIKCKLPLLIASYCTLAIINKANPIKSGYLLSLRLYAYFAAYWLAYNKTLLGPCFKTGRNDHQAITICTSLQSTYILKHFAYFIYLVRVS